MSSSAEVMERLFLAHRGLVFGYLRRRTQDADLASELTQDTFVRAARNLTGFAGGSETAWLLTIARNLLIDHWKRRRVPIDHAVATLGLVGPDAVEDEVVDHIVVRDTLQRLNDRDRRLLTLLYLDGFSPAEVAEMSGVSAGTIRMAAMRARTAFRDLLQPANEASNP